MIDQEEIIRIVAKEHDVVLGKDDAILVFLTVHDTLLEARMEGFESDLQDSIRRITDKYQDRAKELAEKIVGDAVRKIAAERQEIQNGMLLLRKQEQTENRELMRTMKLVAGIVFAASFISSVAMMTALFIMT